MQWSIPSIRWNSPGAVPYALPPGCIDSSNPNRLITPSMSTASTGSSLASFFRNKGIEFAAYDPRLRHQIATTGGRPLAAILHRRAEHQSARPQGTNPQEEEDVDAGPEVGAGSQEAGGRAPAPRRLHAGCDRDTEE